MLPRLVLLLTTTLLLLLCTVHSLVRTERKWLKVRKSAEEIHLAIQTLVSQGRVLDALAYCDEVEDEFGTLHLLPNASPSLFSLKGASLYQLQRMSDAEEQFLLAVRHNPNETRAWINIGEIRVQTFRLTEAITALERAFKQGDLSTVPRIVRTKGWSMDWRDFELYASDLEKHARICAEDRRSCRIDSAGGFEYTDIGAEETLTMERISPHAAQSTQLIDKRELATYWPLSEFGRTTRSEKRLRVGFVSSDFGVHPVATLIRGLFQFLDRSKFEVFCFSLNPQISWWGSNISAIVDHFVSLPPSKNVRDGAEAIASFRIEILIELNGHTLHSGLNLLSHRPAPVQMTYLGLPTTSGSEFVDYFVGDRVASPPELRGYFTEKLILMHPCYIANDYAQLQGDLLQIPQASRTDFILTKQKKNDKEKEEDKEKEQERMRERERLALNATLLLGTLSNSQKVDPLVFHTWMNILRRFAGSKMVFNRYAGSTYYEPNIDREARLHGVASQRVFTLDQRGWIDHLAAKSALDLVLDTRAKNGHTTGLDGVWAGVPTLTFGGGKEMQARAGQSIAAALNCDFGVAFSLKEYEDIAEAVLLKRRRDSLGRRTQRKIDKMVERHRASVSVSSSLSLSGETESDPVAIDSSPVRTRVTKQEMLATMPDFSPLRKWRDHVQRLRNTSYLFDTRNWTRTFERLLEASWEAYHITSRNNLRPFHIFSQTTMPDYAQSEYVVPASQMYAQGSKFFDRPGRNMEEIANIRAPMAHKSTSYGKEDDEREGDEDEKNLSESVSSFFTPSHSSSSSSDNKSTKPKTKRKRYTPIPDYVFDGRLILLNIGGVRPANGWLNVNAQPAKNTSKNHVDIVREMHDLRGLPNNSVSGIYSSHTLEHVPMGNGMVNRTLAEWHRVLRPGGILLLSVPDLENIARMYLDETFTVQDRWFLTNVLFGGQHDSFDFHYFGYSADILGNILKIAGFCDIRRVGPFNMAFRDDVGFFTDSSDLVYKGYLLSLNVVAKVCSQDKPDVPYDDFSINANPVPYAGYMATNYAKEIRETYFAEGKIRKAED